MDQRQNAGGSRLPLRRRELIRLIFGTGFAWPLAARAQQPERVRRVGVLMPWREDDPEGQSCVSAFARGLVRAGWVKDKNIRIDYRFASSTSTLLKTYAAELVELSPDVILASSTPAVAALRQQTRTMPIVFVRVSDPVGQGFVQSLARPGDNMTGFSAFDEPLMGKWLQLLKEIAPGVTRVAVIFNPDTAPAVTLFTRAIKTAAPSFGTTVTLAPVHDDPGIEEAIAALAREPGGGLICLPDIFNITHREIIVAAAFRHSLPLIGNIEFAPAGGLMSYQFDPVDLHAQAASYIDKILRGAKPADLPVQQPTKYSLVINLKTAKVLGLVVPPSILARADEVIE